MYKVRQIILLSHRRFMSSSAHRPAPLLLSPSQAVSIPPESRLFVDATWFMPNVPRNPKREFEKIRLPDAQFLDLDEVATHTEDGAALGLKHMMPSPVTFAKACEDMGIKHDTHVILYDTHGILSAPRALFMFRAFSHHRSSVLDGGLPNWVNEGHNIETDPPNTPKADETLYAVPTLNESVIRSYAQMVSNSNQPLADSTADIVVDARSRGRYLGTDPEPRPGLSSGHIPQSFSLPFTSFLSTNQLTNQSFLNTHPDVSFKTYGTFRSPQELSEELHKAVGDKYAQKILSGERGLVTTCGSGMTAAILWLGINRIWEADNKTPRDVGLYDESWTGYAARKESKINKNVEPN